MSKPVPQLAVAPIPDWEDAFGDGKPLARAATIPASWYVDPCMHVYDRESVFRRYWHYLGALDTVRETGACLSGTVGGAPVFVVRAEDGELRAFYNVCRHRAGPVANDGCKAGLLRCAYHGWTYNLDGSLRGTPQFAGVEDFDRERYGLNPIRVEVFANMVFVCLDHDAPGLDVFVDGLSERMASIDIASKRFHSREVYVVESNWKVYADNYLEAYHVPHIHPKYSEALDYRHYTTEVYDWYSVQHTPLTDDADYYLDLREADGSRPNEAFYVFLFPTTMLNVIAGRVQVNAVRALGPDRCEVIFDYYYDEPERSGMAEVITADLAASARVQSEDAGICAHVQAGLSSGGYDRGRLSVSREAGVQHFQDLLRRCYRSQSDGQ